MKNRLLQTFISTNFLFLFLASFTLTAIAPFVSIGTASAATTNYLLKYPDGADFKKSLKDAYSDDGKIGGDDMASVFNKMTVYTKGGRLNGGAPVQLKINSELTQKHDMPIFDVQYVCYPHETNAAKRLTTDAPDNTRPYVQTTLAVGLTNNNKWEPIIDDKAVNTYVGSSNGDKNNIGKVHFPEIKTGVEYPGYATGVLAHDAADVDIPGKGGDNDLRSQVDNTKYNSNESNENVGKTSFTDYGAYPGSTPGIDNDVATIGSCLPRPDGGQGKITQVYGNLSDDDKKAWDELIGQVSNQTGDDPTGSGNGDANVTCETSGFNLSWIMCPIFNGLSDASDFLLKNIVMPLLQTDAICLSPDGDGCKGNNGAIYSIWSNFRIYGNIFLVIALLVIVFGESIGGGLVDAYTVKKVLPRLLAAAILINLSIYIVAALVDITNILGTSIGQIMTAPLSGKDAAFEIKPGGLQLAGVAGAGIVGGFLGGASLLALFSSAGAAMLLFVLVIPAILAILGIFFTIILRNAAITALVLVSPIAFAFYCLPNTEKYFKKWWDLLTQMLLVYPIIVMVFAVSSIMSVITGGSSSTNPLNAIISFALLIIPLFLIPYAFKLAGNALGQIHGALAGGGARINKMAEGQRERRKERYGRQVIQNKVRGNNFLQKQQGKFTGDGIGSKMARRTLAGAARNYAGYNIEAISSANQAAVSKELEDQIATGRDEEIRGLLVDKKAAMAAPEGELMRMNNGTRQFKSLGGAWIDEAHVDAGQRRWGADNAAKQAALGYEIRKTDDAADVESLAKRYQSTARATGMSDDAAYGAWKGATYANAGQHLALKHTGIDGTMSEAGQQAFVQEVAQKKGGSQISQMHAHSIAQLTKASSDGKARMATAGGADAYAKDEEMVKDVAAVAETFVSRYGGGGAGIPGKEGEIDTDAMEAQRREYAINQEVQAAAIRDQQAGLPVDVARNRQVAEQKLATSSFGAAKVGQEIRKLAVETGVLQRRPEKMETQSEIDYPRIDPL